MAYLLKDKQRKIERRYKRLIGETIDKMKNNTWEELVVELEKLKSLMKNDFIKAGIHLSESS